MKNLSIWLPPFSPDYSGAASVLFDFNSLTAMHDASGCTGNYTGYDEPRWYNSEKNIFCSGLREMDAVLGDDGILTEKMLKAAQSLKPDLTALIGTPVPMLIGTDLKGLAKELEAESGIPSVGIATTGTAYYDKGIFAAWKELIDKFADADIPADEKSVNIVGANPIDFVLNENIENLQHIVENEGYTVNFCTMKKISPENVKRFYAGRVNIAVSQAGFLIADYVYKKKNIPYIAGYPVGSEDIPSFMADLHYVCSTQKKHIRRSDIMPEAEHCGHTVKDGAVVRSDILITGEQIFCNSLRCALKQRFNIQGITAGCVFGFYPDIAESADSELCDESEIKRCVNNPRFKIILADPFFKRLLKNPENITFIEVPHFGISSKFYRKDARQFIGRGGDEFLSELYTNITQAK